ncbi:MAG: c-type cytochrome [Flavobacteriales bacterium]
MKYLFTLYIISSLFFLSCSNNTLEDIIQEEETIETVTFQNIKSTFENTCQFCHANPPQNGAPMPLINSDQVKEAILNRNLIEKISKNEGESGLMPLGGPRLPQQTIDKIIQWQEDGFLEN